MATAVKAGTRRFLLKDGVSLEQVRQVASAHWHFWNRVEGHGEEPTEYHWAIKPESFRVRCVEDPFVNLRYLIVEGPQRAAAFPVIAQNLPVHDRFEILALCRGANLADAAIRAAHKLGIFCNAEFDAELFGCFGDLAEHRMAEVRRAALLAMEYTGWKELAGLLEPMIEDDPVADLRERAAALLKKLGAS
jgi:hypothetical protein